MRTGVLSDEYIKKNCWERTAQVDFSRAAALYPKRQPLKYQNIREPIYMPQQVPRSIIELASNIASLRPKKDMTSRPEDVDIVTHIASSLVSKMNDYDKVLSKKRLMEMKGTVGDVVERVPTFVSRPFGEPGIEGVRNREKQRRWDMVASELEAFAASGASEGEYLALANELKDLYGIREQQEKMIRGRQEPVSVAEQPKREKESRLQFGVRPVPFYNPTAESEAFAQRQTDKIMKASGY